MTSETFVLLCLSFPRFKPFIQFIFIVSYPMFFSASLSMYLYLCLCLSLSQTFSVCVSHLIQTLRRSNIESVKVENNNFFPFFSKTFYSLANDKSFYYCRSHFISILAPLYLAIEVNLFHAVP